jgi:hypothetical protein
MPTQTGKPDAYRAITGKSTGSGAGQAPVREYVEGDRGGDLLSRGCVSPLGNANTQREGEQQRKIENAQQPTRGYGSKPYGGTPVG